jgi:hypothetical protein
MSISKKKGKVKQKRDSRGRFIRKLVEERKELKSSLPVKTKLGRDEKGRFVAKRQPKGLPPPRDKAGKWRKSGLSELEQEVLRLRAELAKEKENTRIERLAGLKRLELVPIGTIHVLRTMIRHNDKRFLDHMRYCRKLNMTPKQARDSWFSPRIQVAA